MHEILLIAELLAFHDDGIQDWVNSRTPEELCEMYTTGLVDDTMLPSGRVSDTCLDVNGASR